MRQWWIEEVKQIGGDDGTYATVTINEPSAVFEDKKIDYNMFLDDYHSDKLSNAVKSTNKKISSMQTLFVHGVAWKVSGKLEVFHWILEFR